MKNHRSKPPRGGVLVFALLCTAVAVVGLTYWIMTVAARGKYIDTQYDAVKRRVSMDNARRMATRYMNLRVVPASAGSTFTRGIGTYFSGTQNYDWGGITLGSAWAGSTLASQTYSTGVNRTSFGDKSGFGLRTGTGSGYDLPIQILDGYGAHLYRWQARSYSPQLGGDLLVVHNPVGGGSPALDGVITVSGRAHFYNASAGGTLGSGVTFTSYGSLGAGWGSLVSTDVMVSNYPPVHNLTWASTAGGAVPGVSNVVWDDASPGYSLKNKVLDNKTVPALYTVNGASAVTSSNGYTSDGAGLVTIDLNNATLDSLVIQNVQTLEITGQSTNVQWTDAAVLPTVLLVVHRTSADTYPLTTVRCRYKNNRRLVLALRSEVASSSATIEYPEANDPMAGVGAEWKTVFAIEQIATTFSVAGGTLNLTGGISTDANITAPPSPGALNLFRENVPLGLNSKSPRRAWAEGYKAD